MLTVTESARQKLKEALVANTDDPDMSLRLVANLPGHFEFVMDKETEDDQVVEHDGRKILLVDSELDHALEGMTIDYEENAEGRHLVMSKE